MEEKEKSKEGITEKILKKIKGKELMYFTFYSIFLLFLSAFFLASPAEIMEGMKCLVISRDALITDYFVLGGMGAAFFNSGFVLLVCTLLILVEKIPFTGPTMAALFINAGYGFWGKNPINILPILFGVWLYARLHHAKLSRYIYTALFGTCLAPFVTETVYMMPYAVPIKLIAAILIGVCIGFILPPLSVHTASMHMGYNLFNVGFSAGVTAFVIVCVMRSFGWENESILLWQEGQPVGIVIGLYLYFITAFLYGWFLCDQKCDKLLQVFSHPGRAVSDFVLMEGAGASIMNMALVGGIATTYILVTGSDFSGPVTGTILMTFGFAAFGTHVKNYTPVLLGVFLFTFVSQYEVTTPGIQLAALFAVGLAPITGQFGVLAGILSGMLHSTIVMCTSSMYGGLNLYNNGFSAGWVAIFMIPVLESFIKRFQDREKNRKRRKTEKEIEMKLTKKK